MQIQLTLEAADRAVNCEVLSSCITQFQRGATLDDQCGLITNGVSKPAVWAPPVTFKQVTGANTNSAASPPTVRHCQASFGWPTCILTLFLPCLLSSLCNNTTQAAAWAYWRMAMPALWSEVPTDIYKAKLMAVAGLLHPTSWARITDRHDLNEHFEAIVDGIRDVVIEAHYHWSDIVNCKKPQK